MLEFSGQTVVIIPKPSQTSKDAAKEWFIEQADRLSKLDLCIWHNSLKNLAVAKAFSNFNVEKLTYTLLGAIDNEKFKNELWTHTHNPTLREFIDELLKIEREIFEKRAGEQ